MALALAMLVAVPAGGFTEFAYFCSMTGELGPKCGCGHTAESNPDQPTLSAASCCELAGSDRDHWTPMLDGVAPQLEGPDLFVLNPTRVLPRLTWTPSTSWCPTSPRGPPPDNWPARYLANCSYLI